MLPCSFCPQSGYDTNDAALFKRRQPSSLLGYCLVSLVAVRNPQISEDAAKFMPTVDLGAFTSPLEIHPHPDRRYRKVLDDSQSWFLILVSRSRPIPTGDASKFSTVDLGFSFLSGKPTPSQPKTPSADVQRSR